MLSLAQLLAAHGTLLVLDSASARVQVGWLSLREGNATAAADWAASDDEAGKALFTGIATLLGREPASPRSIADVGAFVFCEGPGSILGIRTAATALRTWSSLHPQTSAYRYQSLALLAHALAQPDLTLIADARREQWHTQRLGEPLRRVSTSELATHADNASHLAMPEGFRHWSLLPSPALARVPYDLAACFASPKVRDAALFSPAPAPDAFLHSEATYKTWAPQIHRAPVPNAAAT